MLKTILLLVIDFVLELENNTLISHWRFENLILTCLFGPLSVISGEYLI